MIARQAAALFALLALATTSHAALIHRYSFTDGGKDSVGNVQAKLKGAAKVEGGKLVLDNGEKTSTDAALSYLEFASSILPKGHSVTIMMWFTTNESQPYARLLNIGDSEAGEGRAFIYLTARTADDQSRVGITPSNVDERIPLDNARLDDGRPHMVAVVIDGNTKKLHMYVDGKQPADAVDLGTASLDKVRPVDNWIGRSSFENDPGLSGSIDELRVYDHALSEQEVAAAQQAGPDALPAPAASQPDR
jgi:hypothetical protein